jgi:hypothetical protein
LLCLTLFLVGSSANDCTADYGARVGDPHCCGQPGKVDNGTKICGVMKPTCSGFVEGVAQGICNTNVSTCVADFGAKIDDPCCCSRPGQVNFLYLVCPAHLPKCVLASTFFGAGGQNWGFCAPAGADMGGVACQADFGAKDGDQVCCDQNGTVSPSTRSAGNICGGNSPHCTGYIGGNAYAGGHKGVCSPDLGPHWRRNKDAKTCECHKNNDQPGDYMTESACMVKECPGTPTPSPTPPPTPPPPTPPPTPPPPPPPPPPSPHYRCYQDSCGKQGTCSQQACNTSIDRNCFPSKSRCHQDCYPLPGELTALVNGSKVQLLTAV